jgi:hypothetical protein
VPLVAAKSSTSHLCIDGALNPPGCRNASLELDSKYRVASVAKICLFRVIRG